MIEKVLAVALGGAIGAAGRFAVGVLLTRPPGGFPLATFTVNVVGSFAIGVLAVVLMERAGASHAGPRSSSPACSAASPLSPPSPSTACS